MEFIIDHEAVGQRLDTHIVHLFPDRSRSRIQLLIESQHIHVNGKPSKPSYKLRNGDRLDIIFPDPEPTGLIPENVPLDIKYEDQDIIVVSKPRGMTVHPGAGIHSGTLVHALIHVCNDLSGISGELRPGIVHRLDRGTSGLIVIAKNDSAHLHISRQFAQRQVEKEYQALVYGIPDWNETMVDAPIGRDPCDRIRMCIMNSGRSARTGFKIIARGNGACLIGAHPHTGRTHQIRVHAASLGFPILGDLVYGKNKENTIRNPMVRSLLKNLPGFCLHAYSLTFEHPTKKIPLRLSAALPDDFISIMSLLDIQLPLSDHYVFYS